MVNRVGFRALKCSNRVTGTICFRRTGYDPHNHLFMLPMEYIANKNPFIRKAREAFYIKKFETQKKLTISNIEHGLNLKRV